MHDETALAPRLDEDWADVPDGVRGLLYTTDDALTHGKDRAYAGEFTTPLDLAWVASTFGPGPYEAKIRYADPTTGEVRSRTRAFSIAGRPVSEFLGLGTAGGGRPPSWLETLSAARERAQPAATAASPEVTALREELHELKTLVAQVLAAPKGPDPMQQMMAAHMTQLHEAMMTMMKAGPGGSAMKEFREQLGILRDMQDVLAPAESDGIDKIIAVGQGIAEGLKGAVPPPALPAAASSSAAATSRAARQAPAAAGAVPIRNPAKPGARRHPPEVETLANAVVKGLKLATADEPDDDLVEDAAARVADLAELTFPPEVLRKIERAPLIFVVQGTIAQVTEVRPGAKEMIRSKAGKAFVRRAVVLLRDGLKRQDDDEPAEDQVDDETDETGEDTDVEPQPTDAEADDDNDDPDDEDSDDEDDEPDDDEER